MPVIPDISRGALAAAALWKPLRDAAAGAAAYLTQHKNSSATEPALRVWQENATATAPVLESRYTSSGGTIGIGHLMNGVTLRSPNGTKTVSVADSGVAIAGLQVGLHEVDASQIMTAGTGGTSAAANTVALQAAINAGNVLVSIPPGANYDLNTTVLTPSSAGTQSFGIQGAGYGSSLTFYDPSGTSANLLDVVGASTQQWFECFIRDLTIHCGEAMTGGSLIRLKTYINNFYIERVRIVATNDVGGGTTTGPWTAIQVGDAAVTTNAAGPNGVYLTHVKTALTSGSTGSALLIYTAAGVYAHACDLSGSSFNVNAPAASYGVRFLPNAATAGHVFDTAILSECLIKDHAIGVRIGETGKVANVQIIGGHIDGIGDGYDGPHYATTGVGVYLQGAAGTEIENIQVLCPWIALYATTTGYGVLVDTNSGSISGVKIGGSGYITGCKSSSISVAGAPTGLRFYDIDIADQSGASTDVVSIGGTTNGIQVHHVTVYGTKTSGYAGAIGASVTNFNVTGNQSISDANYGKTSGGWLNSAGTHATTKIFANNSA